MDDSLRHFEFASNLSLNTFSSWNKIPFGAEYGTASIGTKRKWADGTDGSGDAFLALSLLPSSSSSENSKASTGCTMSSRKETTEEESSADVTLNFHLHLGNEKIRPAQISKLLKSDPICDLQLSLSTGPSECLTTNIARVPNIDEEVSAESGWKFSIQQMPSSIETVTNSLKTPVACTFELTQPQQRNSNSKTCQFLGCTKGARGASGLCIAHGGGRRCQKAGCHKGAEGRTVYCKAHGGGRRCQFLGCTKSAEGRTDYCIAHGGGRRCNHSGCTRAARGKSGLCIRHGGGKRCQMENCTKSAEGYSGLCISHGGGRRCQYPSCTKGAQGSTTFCKAHGGGKRCTVLGCTKGAEGSTPFCKGHGGGKRCSASECPKSVHGGTQFCVAHGGGKRCAVSECTKSARGRTDYCVRHGGGKRCKSEGCGKSAQGSTDFCKAHGGGKRCAWGGGPACDRFARGKTGLCAMHGALVQDHCVHGGGTLEPSGSQFEISVKAEKLKDVAFVPWIATESNSFVHSTMALQSHPVSLPEGRVHGGSLMAFLSSGTCGEAAASKLSLSSLYNGVHQWM